MVAAVDETCVAVVVDALILGMFDYVGSQWAIICFPCNS
jgi:hypothetical protein